MTDLRQRWDDDQRKKREARARQEAIDSDIARYGESYARIHLGDDGSLIMEHLPREMVRPLLLGTLVDA